MRIIKGIPSSPGIAIGKVFLYANQHIKIPVYSIDKSEIPQEIERFKEAVGKTEKDLKELKSQSSNASKKEKEKDLEIIDTHLMMLQDPDLHSQVKSGLKDHLVNIERVLELTINMMIETLQNSDDQYLQERIVDLYDVESRLLHHLLYIDRTSLSDIQEKVVLVSSNLLPSQVLSLNKKYVQALALDAGGRTSHTAILARSFEIPAVLGLSTISEKVKNGDTIIVDGNAGKVIIRPNRRTVEDYMVYLSRWEKHEQSLMKLNELPSESQDGHRVILKANLEIPDEIDSALQHGAEGVGLYRSEFLFLKPGEVASEQEQYEAYSRVLKGMGQKKPVTIRTIDVGGDKVIPGIEDFDEENPILGWRAVRFCLSRKDIFRSQLKAMLRASVHGKLQIMFPMISGVEELNDVLQVLENVKEECRREGTKFDEELKVGTMIEVPSAALIADIIAERVDFFSIGTNDLIQYTIAVDRGNGKIAYLYQPFHPGVLRFIKMIIDHGHTAGIPVGMCGEMAGDPVSTVLLLGMGLDEFSMSPSAILEVKRIIRSVSYSDAQQLVDVIMEMDSYIEINAYVRKWMNERFEFFEY
ncbi:MAG: phosphoenolpyruvate--protein phosphotransferase [Spirochaetia bacterium]|nr:phosphoenolpyruvate--protein phosphotransferase [Spirochaetia bacterium]MCF7953443.1 phosphoenolpyruvate--protein phosphotransferase [Spirochaetales bacterium]